MIAAVDVDYREDAAHAACVRFGDWSDAKPESEHVVRVPGVHEYEPGAFYKRELPPLLEVLKGLRFDLVVVDGYVWLGPLRKGLGAHLFDAIGKPVIGVAKTRFHDADAVEVVRAGSTRPLYVTAEGLGTREAADRVRAMHGAHRIPTLLKRVDALCRAR